MSQHPFFKIDCPNQLGSLLLTPCPGTKGVELRESLTQLEQAGCSAVLTLMLESEMYEFEVTELKSTSEELDMQWFHFPIVDEGAPEPSFEKLWDKYKQEIHAILNDNESVAIHCKGGSGRTGIVAARILLERGADFESTIEKIKTLRPNAFAHDVQVEYMQKFKV